MIRTAIVSYGLSGKVFHGPLLKAHPGFEVSKILERHKKLSVTDFPNGIIVRSYGEILEDPLIDLVVVNTPDHLHYEMCRQALEAGKHVVVEKPFTLALQEAEQLIGLANEKQRLLTVFQNRRLDGDFMTVKKLIESGSLGHLVEYEAHFDRYRNFVKPNSWREEQSDTGVLYDLGAHMIDQALVLFGMPEEVTAHLAVVRRGARMPDYYDLRLQYAWGAVILKSSFLTRLQGPRYSLHGTDGSFLKWGIDPQEELLRTGHLPDFGNWAEESSEHWGKLLTEKNGIIFNGKIETLPGNYLLFYDNLFQTIAGNAHLMVDPKESRNVLLIMEAAKLSSAEKRTVMLNQ